MTRYEPRTRRFTGAEYDRLIDLGVFQPGEAIELIGDEPIVAEPQGAAHYTAIVKTAKAPRGGVRSRVARPYAGAARPGRRFRTGTRRRRRARRRRRSRPRTSGACRPQGRSAEASLTVDRGHKGSLYARAGLAACWALDP
jgi:hypothetical protein